MKKLITVVIIVWVLQFNMVAFGQEVAETNSQELIDFQFDGYFIKGRLKEGFYAELAFYKTEYTSSLYGNVKLHEGNFTIETNGFPEGDSFFSVDVYNEAGVKTIDNRLYHFTIKNSTSRLSNVEFDNLEVLSKYGYTLDEIEELYWHIENECSKYPTSLVGVSSIEICDSNSYEQDGILAVTTKSTAIHLNKDGTQRLTNNIKLFVNVMSNLAEIEENITHELVHVVVNNLQYVQEMQGDAERVDYFLVRDSIGLANKYEARLRDEILSKNGLSLDDALRVRPDGYAERDGEFLACCIQLVTSAQCDSPEIALVAYEEFHRLLSSF